MNELWQNETDHRPHHDAGAQPLARWTGREVVPGVNDAKELAEKVFEAPFVVVSHGTEVDPVLNYGNRAATLALWRCPGRN